MLAATIASAAADTERHREDTERHREATAALHQQAQDRAYSLGVAEERQAELEHQLAVSQLSTVRTARHQKRQAFCIDNLIWRIDFMALCELRGMFRPFDQSFHGDANTGAAKAKSLGQSMEAMRTAMNHDIDVEIEKHELIIGVRC